MCRTDSDPAVYKTPFSAGRLRFKEWLGLILDNLICSWSQKETDPLPGIKLQGALSRGAPDPDGEGLTLLEGFRLRLRESRPGIDL